MKIYKDKQYLIFDFEDGKNVKYDFATKTAIGKKGKPVKNLCSQLRGININSMIENCSNPQYGKFLRFIRDKENYDISNIGTMLSKVPYYSRYEQIFSAGFENICGSNFNGTINDIPKGLIKIAKKRKIELSDNLVKFYKENPDGYNTIFNSEYESLDDEDILNIAKSCDNKWDREKYGYIYYSRFNMLIENHGYTAKALVKYLDYCATFEAIDDTDYLLRELLDYANMMHKISNKFDKYPRNFLTTHKIASRNYNRLKQKFDEETFKNRIDKNMEHSFNEYVFIYPDCTQDIKNEAVQMNNCVSSYVQKVIDGVCHIMFLRYKETPEQSLVTIEVRNNKIVQALQRFNQPLTKEQQNVVDRWNKWWENKIKENEKKNNKENNNYNNVA